MKKKKIRYCIVLERAQGPTLLDCNYADTCFTAARASVLAGGCTQVPHRSTLYQQVSSTRVTRGPQVCLSTLFLFFVISKMAGKSMEFSEFSGTHILREAPTFSGEQAHWVDYKEKLDDVLFFHCSSLRDILQGQARPEKYVLVPNDVAVIPTYVELRRPIYEAKPIPE